MRSKEKNKTKNYCNVYYPFCKDSLNGNNETLPLEDFSWALVQAYKIGTGGLFVDYDHKKKENES